MHQLKRTTLYTWLGMCSGVGYTHTANQYLTIILLIAVKDLPYRERLARLKLPTLKYQRARGGHD